MQEVVTTGNQGVVIPVDAWNSMSSCTIGKNSPVSIDGTIAVITEHVIVYSIILVGIAIITTNS